MIFELVGELCENMSIIYIGRRLSDLITYPSNKRNTALMLTNFYGLIQLTSLGISFPSWFKDHDAGEGS